MAKLCVTGGCGFIGSAVVRAAVKSGDQVLNVDALKYSSNLLNIEMCLNHSNYQFANVDLINKEHLGAVIKNFDPTHIIHLAAESHVDRSISSPEVFIKSNIIGTFNLLEVARELIDDPEKKLEKFHHVSTDEVFGSLEISSSELFHENSPYDPSSPYSASKAGSDHLVKAWSRTYGIPTVVTNTSNNYGPYQFPEKLIPLTIINALLNREICVYGDGSNIRDWLHVEDHADALIQVLKNKNTYDNFLIGGNSERTNIDVVLSICKILDKLHPKPTGIYESQIMFTKDRPGHDLRYAVDSSKFENNFNWKRKFTFESGLEDTVRWYCNNRNWWEFMIKNHPQDIRGAH